jgi:hypothetical protein
MPEKTVKRRLQDCHAALAPRRGLPDDGVAASQFTDRAVPSRP